MNTDTYQTTVKDIAFHCAGYPVDGGTAPRGSEEARAAVARVRAKLIAGSDTPTGERMRTAAKRLLIEQREGRRAVGEASGDE